MIVISAFWLACLTCLVAHGFRVSSIELQEDGSIASNQRLRAFTTLLLTFNGARVPVRGLGTARVRRAPVPLSSDLYEARYTASLEQIKQMTVADIKLELDVRNIGYADLFDKSELVSRLAEARAKGEVDPGIIDDFNKIQLEQSFGEEEINLEESVQEAMQSGNLPPGVNVDAVKAAASNPEIMELAMNPKFQDLMRRQMTDGEKGVEAMLAEDPELRELARKASGLLPDF